MLFSVVVPLLLTALYATASSTAPRPLKRIAHPSTLTIEILPRKPNIHDRRSLNLDPATLSHSDSFRLTLSAFDQIYHLHLRPNDHLVHPAARINYFSTSPSGQTVLTHTEPLLRESVKAYWGEVVSPGLTSEKLRQDASRVLSNHKDHLGWARIMVHDQGDSKSGRSPVFEGAFTVNGVTHHVASASNYLRNKHQLDPHIEVSNDHPDSGLVIWRDSDILAPHEESAIRVAHGLNPVVPQTVGPASCAHDSMTYNTDPAENPALRSSPIGGHWYDPFGFTNSPPVSSNESVWKRDDVAGNGMSTNFVGNIGQTAGCPTSQKVVYMGVAADCTYTQRYGDQAAATQQILNDWNSASSLYKSTFNVSLGIVELQVFNGTCPSNADPATAWNIACGDVTLNDRLSLFSEWRGNKGADGTGLWHLLSACTTGSEVGIAWLATLCQSSSSGSSPNVVSGTAVSTAGRTEWQVIAHEIGHNFGAIHDCVDGCNLSGGCCPLSASSCNTNSQFIMSPTAADSEIRFSQCSLGNICSLMQGNSGSETDTSCVIDPDSSRKVISLQMCGNGIVEEGEDCDPGSGFNSTCCNPTTCKFTQGAVCDPASTSCCTSGCQFAPSTQICRPAKTATCDTAEYCPGNTAACPADVTAPNGRSCGSNGLTCASGSCTSLNQQCQSNGGSMNLTKACTAKNDRSCLVTCQDPTASNQCVVLETQLIDGSPCGYGGTCTGGSCKSGSWQDTFRAWYRENLQISIPVTVVVGAIALLILWAIVRSIVRCCYRPRTPPKTIAPVLINTRTSQNYPVSRGSDAVYANRPPRSMRPPPTAHSTRPHEAPVGYPIRREPLQ